MKTHELKQALSVVGALCRKCGDEPTAAGVQEFANLLAKLPNMTLANFTKALLKAEGTNTIPVNRRNL